MRQPLVAKHDARALALVRQAMAGRERQAVFLAALAAAFLGLRLSLVWRFPPFWDESFHATWALDIARGPRHLFRAIGFGREELLLSWLTAIPIAIGVSPLTAMRLISVLAAGLTTVMIGLLARQVAGSLAGLAAAAVWVLLPFAVVHESLGLMESLLMALVASALYLQIRLARRPTMANGLLLGIVLAACVLTKESGRVAVYLLPLSLICLDWRNEPRRNLTRWAKAAAVAVLLAGAAYSFMRLSPAYRGLDETRQAWGYPVRPYGEALAHPHRWFDANWPHYRLALDGYLTVPLALAACLGLLVAVRRRTAEAILLLSWVLVALAAALVLVTVAYPRYLALAMPLLAVFAGIGLAQLASLVARLLGDGSLARLAGVLGATIFLIPALRLDADIVSAPSTATYPGFDDEQYISGAYAGTGWKAVADEITRRTHGRGAVIAYSGVFSWALPLELDGTGAWTSLDLEQSPVGRRRYSFFPIFMAVHDPRIPNAKAVRFIIENGAAPRARGRAQSIGGIRVHWIKTFHRPHKGTSVSLFEQ